MMKKRRVYLFGLVILVLAIVAGFVYDKTFNTKHREISKEKTAFVVPADELHYFFANDEQTALQKYLDQTLEVSGEITEIENGSIVIDKRVMVNFSPSPKNNFEIGQNIMVKGRCVGFDELLLQVKIDQASIIK